MKKTKIKEALKEIGLSSTSHGLPNVLRANEKLFKVMWTFLSLLSFFVCLYSIIQAVNSFLNREYITKIDIIQEIPTEFPAVSFCSTDMYQTKYAQDLVDKIWSKNRSYFEMMSKYNSYFLEFLLRLLYHANLTEEQQRRNFSTSLDDFLVDCYYGLYKCKADEFSWFYDVSYGSCFTFNSGRNSKGERIKVHNSSQGGLLNGLKLEFFLADSLRIQRSLPYSGLHVFVHNKTIKPRPQEGIAISKGENTNIVINRVFESKLEDPFSDCVSDLNTKDPSDSEFLRAIIKSNKTYTQNDCMDLCLQNEIIKNCSCYYQFYDKLNGFNLCDTISEVDCTIRITDIFLKTDPVKTCLPSCPLECDSIKYSLSTSHFNYPTRYYAEVLKELPLIKSKFVNAALANNLTKVFVNGSIIDDYEDLKNSVAMMSVYYEDLKYTRVSQIPKMTFIDLLANIGGTLGLFIGVSFLSFAEIFEAIITVLLILMNKQHKIEDASSQRQ